MHTMSTAASPATPTPADRPPSRVDRLRARYHEDHKHPVNHVLHVWVGWPVCAAGVLMLPFRPLWTLYGFLLGYACMWTGHLVFERNVPTLFRYPTTPFVMAWTVTGQLLKGLVRLVTPGQGR
jgi:hypothetical protein